MHWNKYQKLSKVPNQWIAFFARSDWLLKLGIFNNYSPKWRWIAPAGIYREPRRGEVNIYRCSPYGRSIAKKRQMFTCSKQVRRRLNFTKLQILHARDYIRRNRKPVTIAWRLANEEFWTLASKHCLCSFANNYPFYTLPKPSFNIINKQTDKQRDRQTPGLTTVFPRLSVPSLPLSWKNCHK